MFSRTSRLNQKPLFFKNFQGFTYCSVFKVRCCLFLTATRLSYHNSLCLSTTFFIFFLEAFRNPFRFPLNFRAALSDALYLITTPHPCQALFLKFFKICFSSVFWMKRRKRDLNPRAGCPTYTLSRGASSAS